MYLHPHFVYLCFILKGKMQSSSLEIDTSPSNSGMSITDVMALFGVSSATVRNWIKLGYLESEKKGLITNDSVAHFSNEIAGKYKLVARANKLLKDIENEMPTISLSSYSDYNQDMGDSYESSLTESYRNKEGIFFTPEPIVSDMMSQIEFSENGLFLDPCCGSGNFLIEAIRRGVKPESVYGFDTDENAVKIAKYRVKKETGFDSPIIVCGDFLSLCQQLPQKFDYIFTNPPWGKKISKKDKLRYSEVYDCGNSIDTCSLFFAACLSVLNDKGCGGLLLPEAFFNIGVYEDIRTKVLEKKIIQIKDYGKPFKGLLTKACAIIVNNDIPEPSGSVVCETSGNTYIRKHTSFLNLPKKPINYWLTQEESDIIQAAYRIPHITLKSNTQWGLGIVTGNNTKKCKTRFEVGLKPIYRGQDIFPDKVCESGLYIEESLKDCQQVAPLSMYNASEKLIYRFISSKLVFYCDTEQRYILNSANMIVLDPDFPLSGFQLASLLNGRFMNWLFKSLFCTHKVLRGDLELLPVYLDFWDDKGAFDERQLLDQLNICYQDGTYRFKD